MKELIGYKVLTKDRKSIIMSCPYYTIQDKKSQGIYYPVHKKTIPNKHGGPLCVFDTHLQANRFSNAENRQGIVVKCHYTKSAKRRVWTTNKKWNIGIVFLPLGTILADSVTCLE